MNNIKVTPENIQQKEKHSDFRYIQFTRFKNGLLAKWIHNYFESKINLYSNLAYHEMLSLIFMFLVLLRCIKAMTMSANTETMMYWGIPWVYLGGNLYHIEFTFFLWTVNYLVLYLYVIRSPTEHYKWLEIYGFLTGIVSHEAIGIYS